MNILSPTMLAWIVGTIAAFWIAPERLRHRLLPAIALAFLLTYAPLSAGLLIAATLWTYFVPRLGARGNAATVTGIAGVLGMLVWFKWSGGADAMMPAAAVVPLGLSYYTFRCIHYLFERYKGDLPRHGFLDFVAYLFFLPTLIAGPIHRFGQFHQDLRRHHWDWRLASRGLERMIQGAALIVIFGNWLVSVRLTALVQSVGPADAALREYLDALRFGLNVYFQFAGYSGIAIGFAMILGFRIIENFDHPFLRRNISEFWRAWHISLSSWSRDYVYLPVVSTTRRVEFGAIASMLVIGLWHELSFRYLAWGLYHALGIVFWQVFRRFRPLLPETPPRLRWLTQAIAILLTFNFVILSFAITKEPTLSAAIESLATIFGF